MDRGPLAGCSPWGHKESDMTEHACMNNTQTDPCHGHLPSTSAKMKSCAAAAAADLQHPCKEFSVESRNEALRALEKAGRTGRERVRYFQEMFSRAHVLHLLIARKTLKSFMVTSAPRD